MMRMSDSTRVCTIAAVILAASSFAGAADWPRWLGPDGNGVSPETGIFGKASPTLEVAWTKPLGIAYSGIAIAGGKAVTMYGDGETDWLVAMNSKNGEEIWRYKVDEMFPKVGGAHGGQLSMPTIDGDVVYGLGAKGQLFAVSLKDGSEIWSIRIDEKLGAKQPHFGFTTTPLVVGDLLFVETGGSDGRSLTAVDKKNGKGLWSTGDDSVGYQSPVLLKLAGREQIVAVTNRSVAGLDPGDGAVLWSMDPKINERDGWSTPITLGNDSILLTGRNESVAIVVARAEKGSFVAKEAWRGTNLKGNFAMPVVHQGHIYGYDADFLTCVDASNGDQLWKHRADAAGLILVDGHLVLFASDGAVVIGEASPEGFEEKAKVQVSEEAGFTYPSFSDGGIYVRNMETISRVNIN
jgi:outer membrane protein assembly factor BamB